MSYYSIPLKAGQPFKQNTAGSLILIDSLGGAAGVDIMLTQKNGSDGMRMPSRGTAFRLVEPYDAVTFTSAVDTTIGVFLSNADVQLGFVNGGTVAVPGGVVVTNDPAHPVNVTFAQQIVPLGSVTVNNTPAQAVPVTLHGSDDAANVPTIPYQAQAVNDPAPVAIAAAVTAIAGASAARRGLRMKNAGANPVAIGGAGVTFSNAAVVLQPGETWNENEAPGAAWYGICAAGLASTLNLQTIA